MSDQSVDTGSKREVSRHTVFTCESIYNLARPEETRRILHQAYGLGKYGKQFAL